ncbi:hypothetical protein GF336_03395 [Candidatus Woesearchaeota archaeon]|nr:hypothetical protein [Candidatus Woesearchaeota archaeon]
MITYRFRLSSDDALFKEVEELAPKVHDSIESLKKLNSGIEKLYKQIKNIYPRLSKLNVQKVKLSETPSRLRQDEKIEDYLNTSSEFMEKAGYLLDEVENIISLLKKIINNTNTLIYREDKELNRLASRLKKLDDPELSQEILNKINSVKEEIKTTVRRLLESARAQEHELFVRTFDKKPLSSSISDRIKDLGMEASRIDDAIEKLDISHIDKITEKSEKQLLDLKRIEFLARIVVPKLDNIIIDIKNRIHVLPDDKAKKAKSLLEKTELNLEKAKKQMTSQIQHLFERIKILY